MNFYMVELAVSQFAVSKNWYQDVLGFKIEKCDEANQFVLLASDNGCRLALKVGQPQVPSVQLHFEVKHLDTVLNTLEHQKIRILAAPKVSAEGYRRVMIADPDGYRIVLFEWIRKSGSGV